MAVVLAGGFVFVQANSKAYACTSQTIPAPSATPLANGSPAPLGQVQADMGRNHILPPESQRYAECPPASGNHYAPPGGPIIARYYGPDDATLPQGWIHNLEHGGLVILYNCDQGACDDATQQALQDLFQTFPDSPSARSQRATIGPVIARFEDMKAPIAALLWGRVLFQDKLDTGQILDYFATQAELHNPEPQCARRRHRRRSRHAPSAPEASLRASASRRLRRSVAPSTAPSDEPGGLAQPVLTEPADAPVRLPDRERDSTVGRRGRRRAADRRPARADGGLVGARALVRASTGGCSRRCRPRAGGGAPARAAERCLATGAPRRLDNRRPAPAPPITPARSSASG